MVGIVLLEKRNDKVMEILVIMKYVPLFLKHLSAINASS